MRRNGFTLVEVLVVLAILSLLLGLSLPAVQTARNAALKVQCANHLRQLGLSLHAYEASWGGFPPSHQGIADTSRNRHGNYSIQSALLPDLEQNSLYNAINFSGEGLFTIQVAPSNQTILMSTVDAFLCPADVEAGSASGATSYRANAGVCKYCPEHFSGPFQYSELSRTASFRDGLSHTLAFSEKPIHSTTGVYSPFQDWILLHSGFTPRTADEWKSVCSRQSHPGDYQFDSGQTWLLGGSIYTHFFVAAPPNSPIPDCGYQDYMGTGLFSARSYHAGGVNAVMADGSVQWFPSSIHHQVWKGLGTKAGAEVF